MIWKTELELSKPLMNAAGMLGFAPDMRSAVPWDLLGAFVTNPISLRPRTSTLAPAMLEYPGGFLLHTGLPNPGFATVLHHHAKRWKDAPQQIVVHLMADRPEETQGMVRALETVENVRAVELGFAPLLADDIVLLAIEMSRGELPLIACLPAEQVLRVGRLAVERGASAVSVAAPRGTLNQDGRTVSGRLYGPSLFPAALDLVYAAAKARIPIIGAGGVVSLAEAEAMIGAGAIGVQMDSRLWLPTETKKAPSK
jgi:dihydroorotate dehydrogenase (NAD+) catalytic subunit